MSRDKSYMEWLEGVGRKMQAARKMASALSDMRDIECYDRLKCEAALREWDEASGQRASEPRAEGPSPGQPQREGT